MTILLHASFSSGFSLNLSSLLTLLSFTLFLATLASVFPFLFFFLYSPQFFSYVRIRSDLLCSVPLRSALFSAPLLSVARLCSALLCSDPFRFPFRIHFFPKNRRSSPPPFCSSHSLSFHTRVHTRRSSLFIHFFIHALFHRQLLLTASLRPSAPSLSVSYRLLLAGCSVEGKRTCLTPLSSTSNVSLALRSPFFSIIS